MTQRISNGIETIECFAAIQGWFCNSVTVSNRRTFGSESHDIHTRTPKRRGDIGRHPNNSAGNYPGTERYKLLSKWRHCFLYFVAVFKSRRVSLAVRIGFVVSNSACVSDRISYYLVFSDKCEKFDDLLFLVCKLMDKILKRPQAACRK